jgi:predicted secreted Zn-dependent protease
MTNRRAFIRNGASLAMVAALPLPGSAIAAARSTTPHRASFVIVDSSLDTGAAFAAAVAAEGRTVRVFSRDVAGLWMREIEPLLRAGPVMMTGHTSPATLFCLDLLARDYGARTVRCVDFGASVTWVISSSPGQRAALAPAAVRAEWSQTNA